MTTKTEYVIYVQRMIRHQVGERYEERQEYFGQESQEVGTYKTEAEGLAALEAYKPELTYEIIHNRHGLDSIVFDEAELHRNTLEIDADGYEDLLDSEAIASANGITEEVEKAAKEALHSYWKYLDYEADEYYGIEL